MRCVKFNESSVLEFRNVFIKNNDNILECIDKMSEEINKLPQILNTPKSSKKIQDIITLMSDSKELINTNKEKICDSLDIVFKAYNNFNNELKQIMGDVNE